MPPPRLRQTARGLLLDQADRLLLARHDLRARHFSGVVWAPPGGGVEPGESLVDAVIRELLEEVGYRTSPDEVRHVWHQVVVTSTYAEGWDGAIHDYFVVRCDAFEPAGSSADQLLADEGITQFKWWTLDELIAVDDSDLFRPRQLPTLLGDLLAGSSRSYPISI